MLQSRTKPAEGGSNATGGPAIGVQATQRLDVSSKLRIVDAILSGTHERGTSHYELLRAFVDDETLGRIDHELNVRDYRTHEFGDSVFLERAANKTRPLAQSSVAA